MKFLKYLALIIVALVLVFFLVGLLKPSVNYGHTVIIDKPVEEVWAFTQDGSKYELWLEGFKSMELVKGEHGVAGCVYKVIVDPGNGEPEFEMMETLNSIKENEMVDMSFTSEFMDFEQVMTFSEEDGKTKFTTDSKAIGNGLVMKSIFGLMEITTGSFQSQEEKNIEALKKVLEENTTNY